MDVNRINFRHLRAFCEVSALGSISGAARRVHLSQPAVTQAIAKIEMQVGVALFERTTEGLLLTEPGELFRLRAERAIQHIEEGTGPAVRRGAKPASGPNGGSAGVVGRRITAAQLRALLAVAKTGSFSRAARLIGMSQSALYRMARSLESDAGIALFEVVSRGVVLTRAADRLARHAALAFEELEQALEDIAAWSGRDTARVRIGTLPLARTYLLPHAINAFLGERPDSYLSVVDGPYDTLIDALRHGQIDMLIGALRAPEAVADIEQQALFKDRLALVARPDHPLAARPEITLEDLSDFSWIVPRPGAPTRSNFEGMFEACPELRPAHVVEASSLILIRGILTESDAVALISAHQIRHEESLNILARLNFRVPSAPRQIGLSVRRNWRPTASQQRMIDLLFDAGAEVAAHYPDPH